MNVVLIMMTLYTGSVDGFWAPEYAIRYGTEVECVKKTHDYTARPHNHKRGYCVLLNNAKLELSTDIDHPIIIQLTDDLKEQLDVHEQYSRMKTDSNGTSNSSIPRWWKDGND